MFGGGRKKSQPSATNQKRSAKSLTEFGLLGMGEDSDDDLNDAELEAELSALTGGGAKTAKKPKPGVPVEDLERMVAMCMKDSPSDDEDDQDVDDDPDLLTELADLGGQDVREASPEPVHSHNEQICAGQDMLSIIESRISMYTLAEQKAKAANEAAKARRFTRGLATLTQLRKSVKAGKAVDADDIPPAIAQASVQPVAPVIDPIRASAELPHLSDESTPRPPVRMAPPPPAQKPIEAEETAPCVTVTTAATTVSDSTSHELDTTLAKLKEKREHYKHIALTAKKEGDKVHALSGLSGVKKCDELIKAASAGQAVNLEDLPDISAIPKQEKEVQQTPNVERSFSRDEPIQMPENPEDLPPADPSLFGAPPPPATVEEALQQRLSKYREDEAKAKQEGNTSRARRLGRICQQYVDALKLHKAGKQIPVDDLPTPPGFASIPDARSAATTPVTSPQGASKGAMSTQSSAGSLAAQKSPAVQPQRSPVPGSTAASPPGPTKPAKKPLSHQEKQLLLLEKRQNQFKQAALEAKKNGEIELAKDHLRQAKGFDKLIEATKSGLPVDMTSIPIPPQETKSVSSDFMIVSVEDCTPDPVTGLDRQETFSKLEKELVEQIKMCDANRIHFKSTGDISMSNKFQQMGEHTKRDLTALRSAYKHGDQVPKFRYELRAFSRVVCNFDLSDNELEFNVIQATLRSTNPKELQSYCRIEFPYPKETPFKDRTALVKSANAEYNHKSMIPLNIKDKSCQRAFKRGVAKVEVLSKGGFLRSDTLIGTAQIKLATLETSCVLHEMFPLMEGRRPVGSEVEVLIRIRNPIFTKQVEKVEEKWLVLTF